MGFVELGKTLNSNNRNLQNGGGTLTDASRYQSGLPKKSNYAESKLLKDERRLKQRRIRKIITLGILVTMLITVFVLLLTPYF